jgi:adenylate kinase
VLPPLRVLLIGGVASGKGTLAPMISHAFSCRVVGIGQLLRGETRAGTRRGLEVADLMAAGALLDDRLVLKINNDRLAGAPDSARSGWLLDGFPRTQEQVEASLNSPECP